MKDACGELFFKIVGVVGIAFNNFYERVSVKKIFSHLFPLFSEFVFNLLTIYFPIF